MVTRRDVVRLAGLLALAGSALSIPSISQSQDREARFYVIGMVNKPGEYVLEPETTVADAIDLAGGFARQHSGIEIIRLADGERQAVAASLTDAVKANDTIRVKP